MPVFDQQGHAIPAPPNASPAVLADYAEVNKTITPAGTRRRISPVPFVVSGVTAVVVAAALLVGGGHSAAVPAVAAASGPVASELPPVPSLAPSMTPSVAPATTAAPKPMKKPKAKAHPKSIRSGARSLDSVFGGLAAGPTPTPAQATPARAPHGQITNVPDGTSYQDGYNSGSGAVHDEPAQWTKDSAQDINDVCTEVGEKDGLSQDWVDGCIRGITDAINNGTATVAEHDYWWQVAYVASYTSTGGPPLADSDAQEVCTNAESAMEAEHYIDDPSGYIDGCVQGTLDHNHGRARQATPLVTEADSSGLGA